jgi:hypothetical protein
LTEYELIDAFASIAGIMQGSLTLYLTVVTGYLVLTYLVGDKLTVFQVVIISTLFVTFAGGFLVGVQNYMTELINLGVEIRAMGRDGFGGNYTPVTKMFIFVVDLFGIAASLVFMLHTRRARAH